MHTRVLSWWWCCYRRCCCASTICLLTGALVDVWTAPELKQRHQQLSVCILEALSPGGRWGGRRMPWAASLRRGRWALIAYAMLLCSAVHHATVLVLLLLTVVTPVMTPGLMGLMLSAVIQWRKKNDELPLNGQWPPSEPVNSSEPWIEMH